MGFFVFLYFIRFLFISILGNKILIHNYGHGGSGVTLAWGCAEDVIDILEKSLEKKHKIPAKL